MRVSIGERLGRVTIRSTPAKATVRNDVSVEDYVGSREEPERVLCLAGLPTSSYVATPVEPVAGGGPPRLRGEMVWLHKTAPTLVIEGRAGLSPEEHEAGRRR